MDSPETSPAQPPTGAVPPGSAGAPEVPGLPEDGPLTVLEALAAAAWLVPAGHAVSYGGLAALACVGGPRQAGRALAESPDGTPWWRVVRADGSLPTELAVVAQEHWDAEGMPVRRTAGGPRVDLAAARWEPDAAALSVIAGLAARTREG